MEISISYYNIGKYIRAFDDTPQGRKTQVLELCNAQNELIHLGQIKWHGSWRQYCFFPVDDTVFNKECLNDITKFLELINKEYKENIKKRKENHEKR